MRWHLLHMRPAEAQTHQSLRCYTKYESITNKILDITLHSNGYKTESPRLSECDKNLFQRAGSNVSLYVMVIDQILFSVLHPLKIVSLIPVKSVKYT